MPWYQCPNYSEEGCVSCKGAIEARKAIGCTECVDPKCKGPLHIADWDHKTI